MGNEVVNKVMLVDDNEVDTFVNVKVLQFNDFCKETVDFTSVEEALEYIKVCELDMDLLPEVILLDLNIPIKSGYLFLEEFQKLDPKVHERCKVVILTSSENFKDRYLTENHPMVYEFFNKPLLDENLESLGKKLKKDFID